MGQERGNLGDERVWVDRLLDIAVAAGSERLFAVAGHRVRGDGYDGNVASRGIRPKCSRHRVAIHPRQLNVEQDEIKSLSGGQLDSRSAVGRVDHSAAMLLQEKRGEVTVLFIIFNEQYSRVHSEIS